MAQGDLPLKYYSISEVGRMLGIEPHVLRYWEKEFKQLSPRKHRGGRRQYTQKDIDVVLQIKTLLYEEKFTIAGAKRHLKTAKAKKSDGDFRTESTDKNEIAKMKEGLAELKKLLDDE